jgi:hypothetical protein
MQALSDLWHGISRHPWRTAGLVYLAFSALFTLFQAINFFNSKVKFEGLIYPALLIALSVVFASWKVWKPSRVCIPIDHTNTTIEVVFGDLFRMTGMKIISVNNFFDSEIGRPVSGKSLHGIFIKRSFGGHSQGLDAQVDVQLANEAYVDVPQKVEGKRRSYPIGTTALIDVAGDSYILVALAESDPATCKASSDVTKMWLALHGAWQRARIESGGHDINVALVGSGLAGLGLPTRDLLNLIILSAVTETKAQEITRKIRIVLHRDRFEDLDLRDVKQHWEQ